MAVITKTFHDTSITSVSGTSVVLNGVTSDSDTYTITNVEVNLSRLWINALYDVFSESGYVVSKDVSNYSLTVMGFKFFTYIYYSSATNCMPRFILPSYASMISPTANTSIYNTTNGFYCSLRIKGNKKDSFVLSYGGVQNINLENLAIQVFKTTNLVNSEIYYSFCVGSYNYMQRQLDIYEQKRYNIQYSYPYTATLYTEELPTKFILKPLLLYNTYYSSSLMVGNGSILTIGDFYKIGDKTYYHTDLVANTSYPILVNIDD